MSRRVLLAALLLLGGCRLWVGQQLNECSSDADCQRRSASLRCADHLCVDAEVAPPDAGDPRCRDLTGGPAPGAALVGVLVSKTNAAGEVDNRGVYREDAIALASDRLAQLQATADHPLWVRTCDDTGQAAVATAEAQALVQQGAVALITTGSSLTSAAALATIPAGVPIMSISGSSANLGALGALPDGGAKLVWSTAISDALQARVLAELMRQRGYQRPLAIYRDDTGFFTLFSTLDEQVYAYLDGGLLQASYRSDGGGREEAVASAVAQQPDVVVQLMPVLDSPDIFNLWSGPDPAWLFTDNSRNSSLWEGVSGGLARLVGSHGTGPAPAPRSTINSVFESNFQSRFGKNPDDYSYVPNAYDAMMLVAAGVVYAEVAGHLDGPTVAQGFTRLSGPPDSGFDLVADNYSGILRQAFAEGRQVDVNGASGRLDFDPRTGTAPGPVEEWVIAPDAGFAHVYTWDEAPDGGLAPQ